MKEKISSQSKKFDAYCKRSMRNAALDIYRKRCVELKRETSLHEISDKILYKMQAKPEKIYTFNIGGTEFLVKNERLGAAIEELDEHQKTLIILNNFGEISDEAIGKQLGRPESTIRYHRLKAINKLRDILEKN